MSDILIEVQGRIKRQQDEVARLDNLVNKAYDDLATLLDEFYAPEKWASS